MLRKMGLFSRRARCEGLLAPGKPIHRVMLMLQQVGRFLPRQAVDGSGYNVVAGHQA